MDPPDRNTLTAIGQKFYAAMVLTILIAVAAFGPLKVWFAF